MSSRTLKQDYQNNKLWLVFNHCKYKFDGLRYNIYASPHFGFRGAGNNLAGRVGECFVKLSHETSSIDESGKALAYCEAIEESLGKPQGSSAMLVMSLCLPILEENEVKIDQLRAYLVNNRILKKLEVMRMLQNAKPYDIDTMFNSLKEVRCE